MTQGTPHADFTLAPVHTGDLKPSEWFEFTITNIGDRPVSVVMAGRLLTPDGRCEMVLFNQTKKGE
jgi:hypothetical protein